MISCHYADGTIKPLKFKIQDEDAIKTIKIDRVIDTVKERALGKYLLRFVCLSIIDGIEKRYELRFFPDTIQWSLYKM